MAQRVDKQIGILAAIEPECHLVQVGLEMLRADLVPCSDDATLEQGECGFRCVGVDVTVNVNLVFVFDCFMLALMDASFDHGLRVGGELIRHNHLDIGANIFLDVLRQRAGRYIRSVEESQIAAALPQADDYGFTLAPHLGSALSANKCFVHLHGAGKHRLVNLRHRRSDSVAQIPRRLVASTDDSLNLICGHALPRLTKQIRSNKPFCKFKVGILKHGTGDHRKLVLTGVALIAVVVLKPRMAFVLATGACNSIRPAQALKNFAAAFIGSKHFMQFNNRHRSTRGAR